MKAWILAAAFAVATFGGAGAQTLAAVKQRGTLNCGVSQGFAGFSAPDSRGEFRGLDADYCRALAAAVLGDATKVRFLPLTAQARFTALQTGEIDVLYRNSTQTFLRDASLGLNQGPVNFYDGQGFAVRRDAGVDKVQQLDGATICVAQGTTHELNLGDVFRARGIKFGAGGLRARRHDVRRLLRRPLRRDDAGCLGAGRRADRGARPGRLQGAGGDDQQGAARALHPQRRRPVVEHRGLAAHGPAGGRGDRRHPRPMPRRGRRSPNATVQRLLGTTGEFGAGSASTTAGCWRR